MKMNCKLARPLPPHQEPDLHLLTQSQTSTSCQKSSSTDQDWLRRADGGAKTLEDDITPPTRILNVFLEGRRADFRARLALFVPDLDWLRRADGGAKTLEDDITPPTRILESGGLMEKRTSGRQILRTTRTLPSRIPHKFASSGHSGLDTPELNLT
ncbi:unnamed protein product [Boreogadus saida]